METDENTSRKDASWFQPDTELTNEELEAAYKAQIKYPQIVKKRVDPPIEGQEWACLSFMVLDKPHKGIYAFVKCRGCWPDDPQKGPKIANREAKRIVKEVDSKFSVKIAKTGAWVPVTNDEIYDKEDHLIREDIETGKVQDDPIRKAEERQQKRMTELQKKYEALKDKSCKDDPEYDKESIAYFSMKKVTLMSLKKYIEDGEKKLAELRRKEAQVVFEIEELQEKYPNYEAEWVDIYNAKRKDAGLEPYDPKRGHKFMN